MLNKVTLIGNLGRDPEMKLGENFKVTNFSIATTSNRKVNDEWVKQTEWHNIVAFGKLAETCEKYLFKGKQVYIEGSLRTEKYTDKNGVEKYSTKIIANEVKFLGSEKKATAEETQYENVKLDDAPVSNGVSFEADDIPF